MGVHLYSLLKCFVAYDLVVCWTCYFRRQWHTVECKSVFNNSCWWNIRLVVIGFLSLDKSVTLWALLRNLLNGFLTNGRSYWNTKRLGTVYLTCTANSAKKNWKFELKFSDGCWTVALFSLCTVFSDFTFTVFCLFPLVPLSRRGSDQTLQESFLVTYDVKHWSILSLGLSVDQCYFLDSKCGQFNFLVYILLTDFSNLFPWCYNHSCLLSASRNSDNYVLRAWSYDLRST